MAALLGEGRSPHAESQRERRGAERIGRPGEEGREAAPSGGERWGGDGRAGGVLGTRLG